MLTHLGFGGTSDLFAIDLDTRMWIRESDLYPHMEYMIDVLRTSVLSHHPSINWAYHDWLPQPVRGSLLRFKILGRAVVEQYYYSNHILIRVRLRTSLFTNSNRLENVVIGLDKRSDHTVQVPG